ncbi:methyltransferase [Dictyobacter aurantiacus]|nr:class I SAM-dependent methyltransferase [Dictyobacter aurantiacus]
MLNSAADPFVIQARPRLTTGCLCLAEDNIATLGALKVHASGSSVRAVPFHDYILHHSPETMDVAAMNLLYQPGNVWMFYGLSVAAFALKVGGKLYVAGAKDRGILTMAKRMRELFGNVETLTISKGQRVLCAIKRQSFSVEQLPVTTLRIFADSKLDEGTQLLLSALEVRPEDHALDIGCGAGFIGLHIAHLTPQGQVTMVDASLAAVAASEQAVSQAGLTNVRVLPSDGAQAVLDQRFDLVATNPPFHQGGVQTLEIAERFIRQSARILVPNGRFYLVANRFLKYEPTLQACFQQVREVAGNNRYKVLYATGPRPQ